MAITVVNAILYVYQTVLPTTQENVRESKLAEVYVHYVIHTEVATILANVYVTQDILTDAVASLINVE